MLSPLQAHIKFLENTIQSLKNRLARPGLSIEEVEDIELQLSLSESALEHYHQAYALELKISGGEPPDNPAGTERSGEGQGAEASSPIKKNEGLVAVETRVSENKYRPVIACRPRMAKRSPSRQRRCAAIMRDRRNAL
jgi:hypothetical protein